MGALCSLMEECPRLPFSQQRELPPERHITDCGGYRRDPTHTHRLPRRAVQHCARRGKEKARSRRANPRLEARRRRWARATACTGRLWPRDRLPQAGHGIMQPLALSIGARIRTETARIWRPAGYRCHTPKLRAKTKSPARLSPAGLTNLAGATLPLLTKTLGEVFQNVNPSSCSSSRYEDKTFCEALARPHQANQIVFHRILAPAADHHAHA